LEQLLQVWQVGSGDEAIHAPLPGTTTSVYGGLTDCL